MSSKQQFHLVVGSLHRGGAQRVCVTVANWLVKQNYSVNLVVVDDSDPALQKDLHQEVSVSFLDVPSTKRSFTAFHRYIKTHQPETILTFNQHVTIVLLILRSVFQHEYRLVARNRNTLSAERKYMDSLWHKYIVHYLTKGLYRYSDTIIAQSEGMASDLIENYNVSEDTVVVINNPVSQEILRYQDEVGESKKEHQILYVGELSHQKRIDRLIQAFKICAGEDDKLQLKIVGDGPKRNELVELCTNLGIEDRVEFCGEVDKVAEYYLSSRATVLTSRYEGFPNVLVESISLGTPVVAFDCPSGPAEIISNGKNGYLVEQNDIDSLSERILDIINCPPSNSTVLSTSGRYKPLNILPRYEAILLKNKNEK